MAGSASTMTSRKCQGLNDSVKATIVSSRETIFVADHSNKRIWPGRAAVGGPLPAQAQAQTTADHFDIRRAHIVALEATIVSVKATPVSASDLLFPAQYRRRALALLFLSPERRLHVREISRLTDASPGTMAKELGQLNRAGLLVKHKVGNQVQFSANEQHPVFPELSGLLRKTIGLADVLADALASAADRIQVAFVFGSMARATEHAGSDIDIIAIGDIDFAGIVNALYPAQGALRREVNPKVFTAAEWRAKLASQSGFLVDVLNKPKIFLIGTQDDLDLLGQPREDRAA